MQPTTLAVLALACAASGCHTLFGYSAAEGDSAPADRGPRPPQKDARALDGARPRDALAVDADTGPEWLLSCDVGQVMVIPSAAQLVEPAIRLDRLALVARVFSNREHLQATRATTSGAWQPWVPFGTTSPVLEDLAAFEGPDRREWLVGATDSGSQRRLMRCASFSLAPIECAELKVITPGGAELGGELDGPMIITTPGDDWLMTFNAGNLLFVAEPSDGELTSWDAVALTELGDKTDDATLTPDGRLLIYQQTKTTNSDGGLWAASRDAVSGTFVSPQPLDDINSVVVGAAGPVVAPSDDPTDFELFFNGVVGGKPQIHSTRCALSP